MCFVLVHGGGFCEVVGLWCYSDLIIMKHMTCVNHREAEQVCINPECRATCSYICFDGGDNCRAEHEACSLAFLSYLLRKSNKIIGKAHDIQIEKLINFHNQAKKTVDSLTLFLESYHLLTSVKEILDPHGLLEPKQKITINSFLSSNLKSQTQVSLSGLEKNLSSLQLELASYLQVLRQERSKNEEVKSRKESNIKQQSNIRSKITAPSPVKSGLVEDLPGIRSKVKEKRDKNQKEVEREQKQADSSKVVAVSAVSQIKKHVPKPPFFSRITNDVQTINTFFYHKFSDVKLLYRASENDFLVSKFHEKCDGVGNTLTMVLTQSDKIIGGFTPLAWRSGGGEWYEDATLSTFLFSLTSGERYPLVNKDKAIWCSQAYGPSFGYPDLEISDRALSNSNSCANFPQCFNNGNYTLSPGSTQMFCGTKNGHFKIKEWEVFELAFS